MKTNPLRVIALLLACSVLASGTASAATPGEKYTFVLVHGATAGRWEWKSTGSATLIEQSVNDRNSPATVVK